MSVILLTTGVPGCGKSYVRASRFLVDDFLVNTDGIHYSNFPLNVDVIAEAVVKKRNDGLSSIFGRRGKKVTVEEIKSRIVIIPDDVLLSWSNQTSGPWDYFKDKDLRYAHIAIDEIHNFVSLQKSAEYVNLWDQFLGEIRHRGCTFEGLTQDIDQVHSVFTGRASLRLELIPAEDLRDPFFKVKMSDWYELKASLTGLYHKTVFEFEKRKQGRSWKTNNVRRFLITPDYFRYYNSFNASLAEKSDSVGCSGEEKTQNQVDADRAIQYEYQRRSRLSLLWWFISRNIFSLSWRIFVACFLFWVCFLGGLNYGIKAWLSASQSMATSNGVKQTQKQDNSSKSKEKKNNDKEIEQGDKKLVVDPKVRDAIKEKKAEETVAKALYKPSMFFDGACWLRNGIKIKEGFRFKDEPYKDRIVKKIDRVERCYTLDDDTVIYMF